MKRFFTSIAFALCITSFVNAQETVTIKLNSDGFGGTRVITSLETNETSSTKLTVTKGTLVELSGSVAEENSATRKFAFFVKDKSYQYGGTIVSNRNPYRFIAEESATYYIRYVDINEDLTANVTVTATEGGRITGAIYGHIYALGEPFEYRAIANDGFTFVSWTDADGNVVCEDEYFSGVITAKEVTYTANFVPTTGIDEVFDKSKDERAKSKIIYDLNGRQVEKVEKSGLYIIDGKTTLVK